ncbi:hypothetical protein FA95DRAFT_1585065 [Auriscalpium vulgare]|uniref:Uncharacterized protein n=1 Tax=Auriscalpium vulgare TaxID=40419 RepID=A0ACB8R9N3_9AGAM|nr:hypothetical protein FA95DRAFT_1585065 [Auriscalpium vulgare]
MDGAGKGPEEDRAEVLQALLSSLAPEDASKLSKEHALKISQKLGELFGDVNVGGGPSEQHNERGEVLNDEGLPIIEISEPPSELISEDPAEALALPHGPDFVPLAQLPQTERARAREEMDRFLDALEEEERVEEERSYTLERERRQEELERRKANSKTELEQLKAAKEMQKKMGKALLQNLSDAREREERARVEQEKKDLQQDAQRRQGKPRKSVSFANLPPYEDPDTPPKASASTTPGSPVGNASDSERSWAKPTMKLNVVERFPSRPEPHPRPATPPHVAPPAHEPDSDDESIPGSPVPADSDEGEILESDGESIAELDHVPSDDEEDGADSPDELVLEDDIDFDTASHQREIALAYYQKRETIGKDTARAMSAHSHGPMEDEWDQPEVPLEATLAHLPPKPAESKFKSSRIAQSYNTTVPSTTPSTSLGASVLPGASTLRRAIRTGKLDDDNLIGGEEGESGEEEDSDEIKAFMDALRRGEVTNAGAEQNADVLVAALTRAYSEPPSSLPSSSPATASATAAATPTDVSESPSTSSAPAKPKVSQFKLNRAPLRGSPVWDGESGPSTPPSSAARSSPKLPTSDTVVERAHAVPVPGPSTARPAAIQKPSPLAGPARASASPSPINMPPAADPPRYPTLTGGPPVMPASLIVDSPSFQPSTARPARQPAIMASAVRESSAPREVVQAEPGVKKVSRFKAERVA